MSKASAHNFTSVTGVSGKDVRIEVGGNGRKNLLAVVAGYSRAGLVAHDETTFYGRLSVVQGIIPDTPDVDAATDLQGTVPKVLFDVLLHDLGPHVFFFPLSQMEGNIQTDEGAVMTIVLAAGKDSVGKNFIPRLNCAGQTVFGKTFAGQAGTPA